MTSREIIRRDILLGVLASLLFFVVTFCIVMLIANPEYEYIFSSQKHCDDKVSEYGFDIAVLPEGKYALFEGDMLIKDGNGDEMISKDTCYLKLRAYMFWSHANERKPLRFLDN